MLRLISALVLYRRIRAAVDIIRDPGTAFVDRFKNLRRPVMGGSGVYASLTGPGQTVTPGELDQAGGFYVFDSTGDGIGFFSSGVGNQGITLDDSSTTGIQLHEAGPGGIGLTNNGAGGYIELLDSSTSGITINEYGVGPVTIQSDAGGVTIQVVTTAPLGFFGATPVAQPAAPVTLADVIAALQALGLVA